MSPKIIKELRRNPFLNNYRKEQQHVLPINIKKVQGDLELLSHFRSLYIIKFQMRKILPNTICLNNLDIVKIVLGSSLSSWFVLLKYYLYEGSFPLQT